MNKIQQVLATNILLTEQEIGFMYTHSSDAVETTRYPATEQACQLPDQNHTGGSPNRHEHANIIAKVTDRTRIG